MEFRTDYYTPMDRAYHSESPRQDASVHMEEPIIPLYQLGQTIPEQDPTGKFKNMIQTAQASIRSGVGNLQLVFMTPHTSPIGGRAKGYGKEVREVMKEVFRANEAKLVGVELPTSVNNLSGLDFQQGTINEKTRKEHLDEVKDAIKFVAEVAGGGGVDIVSWEFPRDTIDQPWNRTVTTPEGKAQPLFQAHEDEKKKMDFKIVDTRTGQIIPVPIGEGIWVHLDPEHYENGKPKEIPYNTEPKKWGWDELKRFEQKTGRPMIEFIKDHYLENQINSAKGEVARWERIHILQPEKQAEGLQALSQGRQLSKEENTELEALQREVEEGRKYVASKKRDIAELEARKKSWQPLEDYAFKKSVQSYAEAGLAALNETHNHPEATTPIHVGPELGWPYYFGGHPQEFKKLVEESRKEMTKRLVQEKGYGQEQAMEEAKTHIKGLLDTSHLGMWLQYFKPLPGETEENRIKRFNKWYMEEVKKLADSDVVGSMQLVDSASAAHGHLPPGQGIFPVVETAKEFQKKGFTGFMVSEGHEEERFGEGRIFLKTWEAFGGQMPAGFFAEPRPWNQVHQAYARQTYSPKQMFGFYTPPFGEYRPWAGGDMPIPFE